MHRVPPWKIILVVIILLGSLWALFPTYQWYNVPYAFRSRRTTPHLAELKEKLNDPKQDSTKLREEIKAEEDRVKKMQDKAIRLGLDLQGGVHLVLDVDIDKVLEEARAKGTPEQVLRDLPERTLEQATMVVRQRVDEWGVAEPLVQKVPPKQIVVELPGYHNPEQAADLLKMSAQLRFHMLADWQEATRIVEDIDAQVPVNLLRDILRTSGGGFTSEFYVKAPNDVNLVKEILARPDVRDVIPNNYTFKWSDQKTPNSKLFGDSPYRSLYLVTANPELTGDRLANAYFSINQANFNEPEVFLQFDRQGARIFARLTRQHKGERLAVVLDNKVFCAPRIQTEITGGSAVITGINDIDEARRVAVALRAGALPADIRIAENDVVGASLGADSIRKGVTSAIGGFLIVVVFMVLYYSLCGVIADFALFLNLFILMACMALLKATFTLPGIAGVILTIGMAVDANVLIFERMREELSSRRSKTLAGIIDRSYGRAFMTIFDANLTTLMTAVVLFQFGTGPIKGFAVTLTLGIVISMFTALFVTRIVFDYLTAGGSKATLQAIPVGRFRIFQNTNYDFIGKKAFGFVGSSTFIVAGILSIALHSGLNPGIDFSGGTLLYLNFQKPVEVDQIRGALPSRFKESVIQKVLGKNANKVNLRAKTFKQEDAEQILASLKQALPGNNIEILSQRVVGPQVGEELSQQALWCIGFGSLLILLYVTVRFEWTYAVAALIALVHDVAITIAVFSMLNKEFTLPIIAAILTIVGYSVNDTIVVFDRIRENCRRKEGEVKKSVKAFQDVVNKSINETLSRTTLTSLTTLLVIVAILLFGGEVIRDFVFALFVGVIVGTYSSVFIASPIVVWWRARKAA